MLNLNNFNFKNLVKKLTPREVRKSDFAFLLLLRLIVLFVIAIFFLIIYYLYSNSKPIWDTMGFKFLLSQDWSPNRESYGALPFIYGTLMSSLLALMFAVPVSIGTAVFITELAPKKLQTPLSFLVEMLAAIPSVVYGLWGIFVLAPIIRDYIQPSLTKAFGFLPFFQGPPFGIGMFSAGIILSIMILPTITTVIREVFTSIPQITREAALTLGATRWEMIWLSVIKTATPGIVSAVILGLGRAMGETMAVTMIIGNRPDISWSLFTPAATMASVVANEYPEASSDNHLAALTAIGLSLFLVALVVNLIARLIIRNYKSKKFIG